MTLTSGRIPSIPTKRDPEVIMKDITKAEEEISDYRLGIARASGNKGRASQHMSKVDRLGADGLAPNVKKAKERLEELQQEHKEATASYSVN